ncbi:unnamed protein product [Moneuplotes crassus]|uniref:ATP-dependent RNA helicase n=1 Tax=Euplotes crassus TaxID=5936 RepID=A0AAD1U2S5_EUPCR|nr:unnamed protein product [Moneuplotes crassus]
MEETKHPILPTHIELEKSEPMKDFLKAHKISKYIRKNVSIDYPTILQKNVIPVITTPSTSSVIIQYTPPAGIKLTYLFPLLTRAIKDKAHEEAGEKKIMIIACASKTRCNDILSTMRPLLEDEDGETPLDILTLDHTIEHVSDLNSLYSNEEQVKKKKKVLSFDILVTTTNNLHFLLENECFSGIKQEVQISSLIVDKIDLHLATDLEEELAGAGKLIQPFLMKSEERLLTKVVLTTNEQEKDETFNDIRKAYIGDENAVVIKLKEQTKSSSRYESVGHLVIECDSELQKYLAFYTLTKFGIIQGRTALFVDTIQEAYKVKIFLEKFAIRSAVVNPEATQVYRKSAVRYFHAGQYDILILVRMKYSFKLKLSQVVNVINFTTPQNIQDYVMGANKLGFDNSSVLTFVYKEGARVYDNKEHKYLENLTKKMLKRHNRSLFVTLPIDWIEVNRLKGRVDDILCTLSSKKIKDYMGNEIKKQILNNKRLKEYFDEHQEEKDILKSSVESEYKFRFLNQNLDFVPDYLLPKHILASAIEKKIAGGKENLASADHITGLTNDLIFVQRLNSIPKPKVSKMTLKYEDPKLLAPEKLEFTSGRKLWKLKHKKRVRKAIKKAKDGYIGS